MGERQAMARLIANQITQKLMTLAEDNIQGYSRKEWEQMHRAPSVTPYEREEL